MNDYIDLHVKLPLEIGEKLERLTKYFGTRRAAIIWGIMSGFRDIVDLEVIPDSETVQKEKQQ